MSLNLTDDKSTLVQVMVGAVRQQAITWANVYPDLCRHMVSLGLNEFIKNVLHLQQNSVKSSDISNMKMLLKMMSAKWQPFYSDLNMLCVLCFRSDSALSRSYSLPDQSGSSSLHSSYTDVSIESPPPTSGPSRPNSPSPVRYTPLNTVKRSKLHTYRKVSKGMRHVKYQSPDSVLDGLFIVKFVVDVVRPGHHWFR